MKFTRSRQPDSSRVTAAMRDSNPWQAKQVRKSSARARRIRKQLFALIHGNVAPANHALLQREIRRAILPGETACCSPGRLCSPIARMRNS